MGTFRYYDLFPGGGVSPMAIEIMDSKNNKELVECAHLQHFEMRYIRLEM